MGVTYKLKDDIIEFILRQKRENPQISCRKLVIAIHAAFGLNVSKSSINAVIKEANLSSPVGRTPTDLNQTKKFTIPREKKVQLFGDGFPVSDKASGEKQNETKNSPIQPLKTIDEGKSPISIPPVQQPENTSPSLSQTFEIIPVAGNEPNTHLNPPSIDIPDVDPKVTLPGDVLVVLNESGERKFEINDMGSFFMRMSYWDFFSKPILEEFFKRHTSLGEEEIRMVDVLACLPHSIFDDPSTALDPQNIWLWMMSGWDVMFTDEEVETLIKFLVTTKIPKFDYFLELGYFCSMVSCVKWILSDGREIILDGRYMSIESAGDRCFSICPIERAVDETTRFINGQETVILHCRSQERFKDVLFRIMGCLGVNHEHRIDKIVLMGIQEDKLFEFDQIPDRTRHFILSTTMTQEDIYSLFKIQPEFVEADTLGSSEKPLKFVDIAIEISDKINEREVRFPVRMVIFDRQDSDECELCVLNIPQEDISANEIKANISRSPQVQEAGGIIDTTKYDFVEEDMELTVAQAIINLRQIVERVMNLIFSQFGIGHDFFTRICKSNGYVIFKAKSIEVNINISKELDVVTGKKIKNVLNIYRRTAYKLNKISINLINI